MTGMSGMTGTVRVSGNTTAALFPDLLLLDMNADENVLTGGARQFYRDDKTSLKVSDVSTLDFLTSDITISLWVYFNDIAGNRWFLSKGGSGAAGYSIYREGTTAKANIALANPGVIVTIGTVAANTWYNILVEFDRDGNATGYLNNVSGTPVSIVSENADLNTASAFTLGAYENVGSTSDWTDCKISRLGFWKRTLTASEKTYLYNAGVGRSYGELGVAATDGSALLTSLISYWNLNETSGTANAIDAHGVNDLVPTFGELLGNIGFETAGGGGADVFGSWIETTSGTSVISDELVIVDAGSHACKWTYDGSGSDVSVDQAVLTNTHQYTFSCRARAASGTPTFRYKFGDFTSSSFSHTLNTTYTTYSTTATANDTRAIIQTDSNTPLAILYFDTVSLKATQIPAADGPGTTAAGTGDPVAQWTSDDAGARAFIQSTAAKRPTYNTAGINSKATVDFDGVDDVLSIASAFLTGLSGHVFMVYRLDGVPNSYQIIIASADEGSATRYISFYGRGNTANPNIHYAQSNNDTADLLKGNTTVSNATNYLSDFSSNSTAVAARLNNVSQTLSVVTGANNGDWWDDSTAKDNVSIGASMIAGSAAEFLTGKIRRILVYTELTDSQASRVRQRLADDAGITI